MPVSSALDVSELTGRIDIPYDRVEGLLSPKPRIISGYNMMVTTGGVLQKRPGMQFLDAIWGPIGGAGGSTATNYRIDRMATLEGTDGSLCVFLSVFTGSYWEIRTYSYNGYWYVNPSFGTGHHYTYGGASNLTCIGTFNYSAGPYSSAPHEFVAFNGKMYVKGFPNASTYPVGFYEYYAANIGIPSGNPIGGSANPVTISMATWGYYTVPAPVALSDPSTWTASTSAVTVNSGWKYAWAWVNNVTGHVGPHSTLQTDPTQSPSVTGAFTNKIPHFTVSTLSSWRYNPPFDQKFNIYRSTDGGGTFALLKQVVIHDIATLPSTFTFDDNLLNGNTPQPDGALDLTNIAADSATNFGPPSVAPPKVMGVDWPDVCTRMVVYANRIWYGIGNYLFYSANEEVNTGNPEECFPIGVNGNFFYMNDKLVTLAPTPDGLYVFTKSNVYRITGTTRDTFEARLFVSGIGAAAKHGHAVCEAGDTIYWLTDSYRIGAIRNGEYDFVSHPLGSDISDAIQAGAEIEFGYWTEQDNDWLIVAAHNRADTTKSKQWVCDLSKSRDTQAPFWFTPWTIRSTAFLSTKVSYFNNQTEVGKAAYNPGTDVGYYLGAPTTRRQLYAIWDGTQAAVVCVDMTGASNVDYLPDGTELPFGYDCIISPFRNPTGNHINTYNLSARLPESYLLRLEYTDFPGSTGPRVFYYTDDPGNQQKAPAAPNDPMRRMQSRGYLTQDYAINHVAERVWIELYKQPIKEAAEFHTIAVVWNPAGGD